MVNVSKRAISINIRRENLFHLMDSEFKSHEPSIKYYLLDVKSTAIIIDFGIYCPFAENTTIEIYQDCTASSNGILMTGSINPISMDIYENPTITSDGTQISAFTPSAIPGSNNIFNLNSSTKYLIKITPRDADSIELEGVKRLVSDTNATWHKDSTKTNIGTNFVNIYPIGSNGEAQIVDFTGYTQYRLIVHYNNVATNTGTQSIRLVDSTNSANYIQINDSTTGEREVDSNWISLPEWSVGEIRLIPKAKSTVGTDDPIYRRIVLLLR